MSVSRSYALLFLLAIAVATGWLQGRAAFRWGPPLEMQRLAKELSHAKWELPGWRLSEQQQFAPPILDLLQATGYLKQRYEDVNSQETVAIAMFVGPTGPMVTHMPEVCYNANAYIQCEPPAKWEFLDSNGLRNELCATTFRTDDLHQNYIRVYYAWSTDGLRWRAPASPRLAFAGQPYLLRLQAAVSLSNQHRKAEGDAAYRFLQQALKHKYLFSSEANESANAAGGDKLIAGQHKSARDAILGAVTFQKGSND